MKHVKKGTKKHHPKQQNVIHIKSPAQKKKDISHVWFAAEFCSHTIAYKQIIISPYS